MKKILLSLVFINLTQASEVLFTIENATATPLTLIASAIYLDSTGNPSNRYPFKANFTSEHEDVIGPGTIPPRAIHPVTTMHLRSGYSINTLRQFSLTFELLFDSKKYCGISPWVQPGAKIKLIKDTENNTYLIKVQEALIINVYKILLNLNLDVPRWEAKPLPLLSLKDLSAKAINQNKHRFGTHLLSQQLPQDIWDEYFS